MENTEKGTGMRLDQNKIRHDLISPTAINELAKVLTFGAQKYAPNNWRKGMAWSRVFGSLKRHLNALERGEDVDPETGLNHAAHIMCNAMFLVDYFKIYPQGDDRSLACLTRPKIGLDIDEVLCDWVGAWTKKFGHPLPKNWNFNYNIAEEFKSMNKRELEKFYLSIPPKISPDDIPFEPHCYITSRSISEDVTMKWLQKNGFACVKVHTVPFNTSKVEVAKKSGIDIFVDDKYENFVELNNAGICTFLLDAPHNYRYEVGYKRIKSLAELV
jgi:hypothetical protein